MAAQSSTEIANRALQMLGDTAILALTDNTSQARAANRCYDPCRKAELRGNVWSFALKRVVLAPDTEAPAFGYAHQFSLPSDFIRLQLPADFTLDWKLSGRKILTNTLQSPWGDVPSTAGTGAALALEYVADIVDPTVYDPLFAEAFATRMALAMCEQITQSNTKKADLKQDYRNIVAEARRVNAIEKLAAKPQIGSWLQSRY